MLVLIRFARHLASVAIAGFIAAGSAAMPATAMERRPVATVTIYPGDVIREQMLTDADFPDAVASSVFVSNHSMIVGKVSKRTILPGSPIPINAIGVPRVVSIGAMVRLVYEEDGLQISTYASALQNGAAGDVISVRNMESGVTLSGVVRADGSIHVGPG
jgi:flagella basal body P-ring formation protein FlgA